jgi:gliding motility-associated protein GldL
MKGSFDLLNFFYGLGAAIVLVAALFKFTGMPYSNEAFILGISVEATVFLVSSFSWKKKQYNWENIFPQLTHGKEEIHKSDEHVQNLTNTLNNLNSTLTDLQRSTKELSNVVGTTKEGFNNISAETQSYQEELNALRSKLAKANESLSALDKFNI